ncbi:MAG: hypothetical protein H0W68_07170 [Gemmatimonadaceae bacterium]|nr:hypothetical protein [Gemmatimonadaceae bacterium]
MIWNALAARVGLALDRRGTRRAAEFTRVGRRDGAIQIAGGWSLVRCDGDYVLGPSAGSLPAPATLRAGGAVQWGSFRFRPVDEAGETDPAWFAALPQDGAVQVQVRGWRAGERASIAHHVAPRRVARYLSDAGVHGRDRAGWPVVVAGEDVVWIPGVGRSAAATDRSGRPARLYVCERTDR